MKPDKKIKIFILLVSIVMLASLLVIYDQRFHYVEFKMVYYNQKTERLYEQDVPDSLAANVILILFHYNIDFKTKGRKIFISKDIRNQTEFMWNLTTKSILKEY